MKKNIFLLLIVSTFGFSQNKIQSVDTISKEEELHISAIEEPPLFKECITIEKELRKNCFNEMMQNHVKNHFKYPKLARKLGIEGTVKVQFVIDKDGEIVNIVPDGPPVIAEEAKRIISLLPRLKPGKIRGRIIKVRYTVPITFKLK